MPFVIVGVVTGSLYGLAALGLVLTYRTSGVFNFAHGALAAAAAYGFFTLHFEWGWPWPLALLVAVGTLGGVGGVLLERLSRGLTGVRTATIIVATVGLLLFVQGFLYWRYGLARRNFPEFLPTGTVFTLYDVTISWAQLINVGVGAASFVGLFFFLRRTRLGVGMRAVVHSPELLGLAGTSPVRVRVISWVIGSSFAALTGILISPTLIGIDAILLTALVVQAFGAVAIGRFSSLPLTYLGGIGVGVLAAVAQKYLTEPPYNGLPPVTPFLVLIAVMLVTKARKLPAGAGRLAGTAARGVRFPVPVRAGGIIAGLGLLIAVPELVSTRLPVYAAALAFVVLFLSLSFLTRVSGQISLAHSAFLAIGGVTMSHLTVRSYGATGTGNIGEVAGTGIPWPVALIGAGLVTGLVGALLAVPAMRVTGVYLALVTFGFGLLIDNVFAPSELMFGGTAQAGRRVLQPDFGPIEAGNQKALYYVILTVAVVCCVALNALRNARLGRYLRAMADSPTALTTVGLGINTTRLIVFSVSAFFAGIAGALFATQTSPVTAFSFNVQNSLLYLAILVVASAFSGFVTSAFVAAGLLVVAPSYMDSVTFEIQSMLFGLAALIAAVVSDGRVDWKSLGQAARSRIERAARSSEGRRRHGPVTARLEPAGGVVHATGAEG
ncbi:MAG: ABC transporter permease subunit [Acidimicrobiia bacterium]